MLHANNSGKLELINYLQFKIVLKWLKSLKFLKFIYLSYESCIRMQSDIDM
jgi:hypothetical protein